MKGKLNKHDEEIWRNLNIRHKLNDVFVRNQFNQRNLKLQDIDTVMLTFTAVGTVFISDQRSTESHSMEIAVMKNLIKDDILNNYIKQQK